MARKGMKRQRKAKDEKGGKARKGKKRNGKGGKRSRDKRGECWEKGKRE